jgi:hypothetical protein
MMRAEQTRVFSEKVSTCDKTGYAQGSVSSLGLTQHAALTKVGPRPRKTKVAWACRATPGDAGLPDVPALPLVCDSRRCTGC